ncbi:MAG: hypothetical protein M1820_007722 [Bogoriella megaspora]|nr:MAG: hypothetical protein M1820_007722 [Bogoriella megaspora]
MRQPQTAPLPRHLRELQNGNLSATTTLNDLTKTDTFTSSLPPDPQYTTPQSSHNAERSALGPRLVKNALYTYVRPEPSQNPELLATSRRALIDVGLKPGEAETEDFKALVSGNKIMWDAEKEEGIYPWAQCYGGYQFGQWAGQLGDGRAISLFEAYNHYTTNRYELQLKGAGKTPYSRFADGKAVLRSSIREFVVSEALNALGIPTTRALSLTLLPDEKVVREKIEPGAIVCRAAQSWIRIGTFDLLRARGDRNLIRQLAEYVGTQVLTGWSAHPGKLKEGKIEETALNPPAGVQPDIIQGEGKEAENRFARLYREIVRRNAKMVAGWQAYAFTNGVLNTDNTSIFGLSIDFGPFAFLDNFDPSYTPNHDDFMLRYAYKNQPSIIWWNLVRLGEALGELIGAGNRADDKEFVEEGVAKSWADELVERAENLIQQAGEEYKAVFMGEYKRLMTLRLGLKECKEGDFDELYSELLDTMEALELDFNHWFRRLSNMNTKDLETEEQRKELASVFWHKEGLTGIEKDEDKARERIAKWLERWRTRVLEDWGEGQDDERTRAMKSVNPKFVPRSWILDELINRVEQKGEREILHRIMDMTLWPFEDEWGWDRDEEERFCGDVPKYNRAMQCSCSS